jgi:hypothetical protein
MSDQYVRVQETTDNGLDGFDFVDGEKAYQVVGRVVTIDAVVVSVATLRLSETPDE